MSKSTSTPEPQVVNSGKAAARRRSANQTLPLSAYPLRMRLDQAADYLNVSEQTIRNLVELGALEAIRISASGAGFSENLNHPITPRHHLRILRESVALFEQRRKFVP